MLRFFALLFMATTTVAAPMDHWEIHPVNAVDLNPNRTTLAVAHTDDSLVLWYDVSGDIPVLNGQIRTGLAPTSVRFRSDHELWVVNHISDSVSVVDVSSGELSAIIHTADAPWDLVFAGANNHAFVSSGSTGRIQRFRANGTLVRDYVLDMKEPRALAVSRDGNTVITAAFYSGNGTTVLAGGTSPDDFPPNVLQLPETPYGGAVPPPNTASGFSPPLNPNLPPAPKTGLIVRRDAQGRWLDGAGANWTRWVSGASASASGRVSGWDVVDHDLAFVDTETHQVRYIQGLWNIGMALAVNPATEVVLSVGTEATNEVRFEPNVNGTFVRVVGARISLTDDSAVVRDLNPHLDYRAPTVPAALRTQSIGDPRSVVWTDDGSYGFVAGMGSNSVIRVNAEGVRDTALAPIAVGEGPNGMALNPDHGQLYVWNRFEATLSVVDVDSHREIERLEAFTAMPEVVRKGRRHLYATHATSGLGQAACASCHVDARTDLLAWDLGSPDGELAPFNQNCMTSLLGDRCTDFHPMKGPMTTQTLQDIIGKEPLHWRGDRVGLADFNGAFELLQGAPEGISDAEMIEFADFLASISLPPNPHRELDNGLPESIATGEFSAGRFSPPGTALPPGDPVRGLSLFRNGLLVPVPDVPGAIENCATCHSLPTGLAPEGPITSAQGPIIGGSFLPEGPNGERHLGIVSMGTLSNTTFKVPQLRTLATKVGMRMDSPQSLLGFGFGHDGTVDSLARFLSLEGFDVSSDQEVADLTAFMLAFTGSDLPTSSIHHAGEPPTSRDTHAAVGQTRALSDPEAAVLISEASLNRIDLIALCPDQTLAYRSTSNLFVNESDLPREPDSSCSLMAVSAGEADRFAFDFDGDGINNRDEVAQGSHPADPASSTLSPWVGLWFNPDRGGHGIDLQLVGSTLVATWYTYEDDGTPVWYQAVGELRNASWEAELVRYQFPDGAVQPTPVGTASLQFDDRSHATWSWTLGSESGSEPLQRFAFDEEFRAGNYTGLWFDPTESGWGMTVDSLGTTRVVVLYFYDDDNQPRWALGSSTNEPVATTPMNTFSGFCPGCDATPVEPTAAGSISIGFEGITNGTSTIEVTSPVGNWQRSAVSLSRLTEEARDLSAYQ